MDDQLDKAFYISINKENSNSMARSIRRLD